MLEALAAQLKPPLQELGVKLSVADGRMLVSLSPDKAIDRNGIDVSGEGNAALKILAGAMKRNGTVARIKAPFGAAPAPKQLRSLFATVGEVAAVRAARVLSALESAGVAPDRLTIVGESESGGEGSAQATAGPRWPPQPARRGARPLPQRSSRTVERTAGHRSRAWLIGVRWLLAGAIVSLAVSSSARAYDFSVDVRTIGQGYQVRGFAPNGTNELLSRRRLTQYLDLNVFDIEPGPLARIDDGGRNNVYVDASLRFDTDFGGYMLGRPTGIDEIRELQQNQVDILYAFVGGRDIGGRARLSARAADPLRPGRLLLPSTAPTWCCACARPLVVEAFAGTEVRGELPLSSPIYELDGTSAGSRDPATRPDAGQRAARRWPARRWRCGRAAARWRARSPTGASGRRPPIGCRASRRRASTTRSCR